MLYNIVKDVSNKDNNLKRTKRIRQLTALAVATIVLSLCCVRGVFAAQCGDIETSIIECNEGGDGGIWHTLRLVLDIMMIGVGILGVIGISWAGIRYLTAGGSEEKTIIAKRRIVEVVVGAVCYVLLWGGLQWLLPGGIFDIKQDNTNVTNVDMSYSGTTAVGKTFVPKVVFNDEASDITYSLKSNNTSVVKVLGHNALCVADGSATLEAIAANGVTSSMDVKCTPSKNGSSNGDSGGSAINGSANNSNSNSNSSNDNQGETCDTSMINKERGLTYKQAVTLAKYIGADKGKVGYKTVGSVWNRCGGGGSNCAAVGAFFYNKFTHHTIKTYDHGYRTIDHIRKVNKSLKVGTTPKVWSLALWYIGSRTYGHTAVVVGRQKDGTWIVVQGSCQRGNVGKRGEGDGTYDGSGSAVVTPGALWEGLLF